jgi:hypothetical protein
MFRVNHVTIGMGRDLVNSKSPQTTESDGIFDVSAFEGGLLDASQADC